MAKSRKYVNKKEGKVLEKQKVKKELDIQVEVDQLKFQMNKVWNALNIKN